MPVMGRFRRAQRLLSSREFRRVQRRGRKFRGEHFVVSIAPRCDRQPRASSGPDAEGRRLGVTVSRKVGNAVERNHVKRRIREWFRIQHHTLAPDIDVVVIARRGAATRGGPAIAQELSALVAGSRGDPGQDRK